MTRDTRDQGRRFQRDVVYLGWPIAPSYMGGEGGVAGSQPMRKIVRRSFGNLTRLHIKPMPETRIQATQHDCLARLLGVGANKLKKCAVRKIIFCTKPTRATKARQESIVPARGAQPTKEGPLSYVLQESPFASVSTGGGATPLKSLWETLTMGTDREQLRSDWPVQYLKDRNHGHSSAQPQVNLSKVLSNYIKIHELSDKGKKFGWENRKKIILLIIIRIVFFFTFVMYAVRCPIVSRDNSKCDLPWRPCDVCLSFFPSLTTHRRVVYNNSHS